MPTPRDAVAVLEDDHREIEELFQAFERSRSAAHREDLVARIVRELSIHASIEEQLVYPRARVVVDGASKEPAVLVALEEHHVAKLALSEIATLRATDSRFEAKVRVLIANVRHHVEEEERDLLPAMERAYTPEELQELGAALERAKRIAPTRPHPFAPDEPPGAMFAGLAAGAFDRSRDGLAQLVEMAADVGRQLVDSALRRGEDAVRRARGRLARRIEEARAEVQPEAVERRMRRGVRAARRAQQRVGEGVEELGRELQPAQ
ncbi:hemerythrin domain-containing protein [Anaeromyxobacter terrae]|uniref:hemerythrin domain-containing protein n=1 Tax=Anaeromyxobacter terrae TaxID=2925406 RepID=UPI001F568F1D|nr:hemerythrin domain-containing protein [Anaeromyxobacter sp. SG22]